MTARVPRRRIFVTYDTARESRIVINDPERISSLQLKVQMACRMSVDPKRNRGLVTVSNLSERTMHDISGVIESTLDLRGPIDTRVPQRNIARFEPLALNDPSASPTQLQPTFGAELQRNTLADIYTPEQLARAGLFTNPVQKVTTIIMGGGYCEIDVGLDEEVGRVFEGSVSRIRSVKTGTEWRTKFEISDGLTNGMGAVANQSFSDGVKVFDIISHVVRSLGLSLGDLTIQQFQDAVGPNGVSVLGRGWTISGNSNQILKQMLQNTSAEWFVDRGVFYIVRKGHPIPGSVPVVVRQDVLGGLRSRPQPIDDKGILIESDFRSDIRIGRLVETFTDQLAGIWRADVVDHRVDNWGGQWMTKAVLRKVPEIGLEFLDG